MKKQILCVGLSALIIISAGCSPSKETLAQIDDLNTQISGSAETIAQKDKVIADHEQEIAKLQKQVAELSKQVEEAKPWFELSEKERDEKAATLETEKLATEEAERIKKENEEKVGYNTGITYSQLARTPDDYKGKKVKFSGRVIQVIEGSGETNLRLTVNGDYNSVVLLVYNPSIVESRILENDYITFYGIAKGLHTYESTMGGMITIPLIQVDKIDQ